MNGLIENLKSRAELLKQAKLSGCLINFDSEKLESILKLGHGFTTQT
jgi:hypothetical protein